MLWILFSRILIHTSRKGKREREINKLVENASRLAQKGDELSGAVEKQEQ